MLDFEAKRQRRQEQPVQEQQQQQQPETSDSAMVDDILDVDLSGFVWYRKKKKNKNPGSFKSHYFYKKKIERNSNVDIHLVYTLPLNLHR